MSTPTPDYGEPWYIARGTRRTVICNPGGSGADFDREDDAQRAVACVNALAGAQDPAAEIARLREALNSFDAIDKERNDALKICMTLLENMHANRNQHKVAAYTDEIEALMAQIKTCYDPHM